MNPHIFAVCIFFFYSEKLCFIIKLFHVPIFYTQAKAVCNTFVFGAILWHLRNVSSSAVHSSQPSKCLSEQSETEEPAVLMRMPARRNATTRGQPYTRNPRSDSPRGHIWSTPCRSGGWVPGSRGTWGCTARHWGWPPAWMSAGSIYEASWPKRGYETMKHMQPFSMRLRNCLTCNEETNPSRNIVVHFITFGADIPCRCVFSHVMRLRMWE